MIDFQKYKNRLKDYLSSKGYKLNSNICCPFHDDKNPSMQVFNDHAICYSGCGNKDIYDFIEIFENISSKSEQYKFAESKFDFKPIIQQSIKQEKFIPDNEAINKLTEYIRNNLNYNFTLQFAQNRGYVGYKAEEFARYLGYWAGRDNINLDQEILNKAGVPKKTWNHEGVICRFENGFKLHYIENGTTLKFGSHGSHTFPYPKIINQEKIMLVEGELDAIACRIIGLDYTVGTGGTNGLNDQDIDKLLTFKEIYICFDGDDAGKNATEKLKNKLLEKKYNGILKIINLPENYDPDKLIKENKTDVLIQCIYNAEISTCLNNNDENIENIRHEELYLEAINTQAQSLLANMLYDELKNKNYNVITEIIDKRNNLKFYIKLPENIYYNEAISFSEIARQILENKILSYLESDDISLTLTKNIHATIKKIRTRDFLNSVLDIFGRKSDIIHSNINWNTTPECLPCLDGVLDFSNNKIISRNPFEKEYFINPVNFKINDILNAENPEKFIAMMKKFFPDSETVETAFYCISQMIANRGFKTFQIWCSHFGNNGKNTIIDFMTWLTNNRVDYLTSSIITKDGDKSERRFGKIKLRGLSAGIFDESAELEHLAINEIKKLTSLSPIVAEAKGINATSFNQTWTLIALTNELPRFYPADDIAFLSRLITLPFSAVFYSNDEEKIKYLNLGAMPQNLHPEENKEILLNELKQEGAGVLKILINYFINLKQIYNYKVPLSKECQNIKNKYALDNDLMQQFFNDNFAFQETSFISNDTIKSLYTEQFSEFPKYNYFKKFADRYRLKQISKSIQDEYGNWKTVRGIYGIIKKSLNHEKVSYD